MGTTMTGTGCEWSSLAVEGPVDTAAAAEAIATAEVALGVIGATAAHPPDDHSSVSW